MGFGDDVMASGMAAGAAKRGKKIAFGDGQRIIWGPWSAEIFRNNPNVAAPGMERSPLIEWVRYYKGHRVYNRQAADRWIWNYEFRAAVGEFYFDDSETDQAARIDPGFVLIEPNVPWNKSVAPNKDWGASRYQAAADKLRESGWRVAQFRHGKIQLAGVERIVTTSFRDAVAKMMRAHFAILPEGGLHHAAAAVGVPAVVLFGGFIPPQITGYELHVNLTGGAEACGSLKACQHCREAMNRISVEEVLEYAAKI